VSPTVLLLAGGALFLLAGRKKKVAVSKVKCPLLSPGRGNLAGFDYIEFTTGGASLSDRLPMIIFFHSLGADPNGMTKFLEGFPIPVRVVMPYGHETYGGGPAWWRLRSKTEDQAELARQMNDVSEAILEFIKQASQCLPTTGRPIIVGHSQGGMMTYAVAAKNSRLVKAAVPVSGWLPINLWPRAITSTIAIHGTKDRTVSFERTADFLSRATSAGLPIEFYPIEGHGHSLSGDLLSTWIEMIKKAVRTDI